MDYYDGNTVTGLWNYAQNYSMSDNNWDTTFGPSTPGALNVISGATGGAKALTPPWSPTPNQPATSSAINGGAMNGDVDPYFDTCSDTNHTTTGALGVLTGKNIGDLLNAQHVTWGWFQGGFGPTSTNSGGAICGQTSNNIAGVSDAQYSPHHNPFEYYASTANPNHLAPSSLAEIGYTDQANHQYDLSYFNDALSGKGGAQLPSVSYLKAPEAEDGHPGYSDRSTSRSSWSTPSTRSRSPSTGPRPRSSSPTTTRTAGTTTSPRRSSTDPTTPPRTPRSAPRSR